MTNGTTVLLAILLLGGGEEREPDVIFEGIVRSIGGVRVEREGQVRKVFGPPGMVITSIDPRFLITVEITRVLKGSAEEWSGTKSFAIHSMVLTFGSLTVPVVDKEWTFRLDPARSDPKEFVKISARPGKAPETAPPVRIGGETTAGWIKVMANPVLGGDLGTCFDLSVLQEGGRFRMWFSWRPRKSVALVESADGISWSKPEIVLGPSPDTDWEADMNRPVVIRRPDGYHMWYTGQAGGRSSIGHATSADGKTWKRTGAKPVLAPERPWEKVAVMCPHVVFDEGKKLFRMWYSGGEQYEPNAIGYAESPDGLAWKKLEENPVFRPDPTSEWEKERVTACQVIIHRGWHLMFYIGFSDLNTARIGLARSRDGIAGWQRHPLNPIIRPGKDRWDHDAVYKPYAVLDGRRWLLWYNGRRGGVEQIGLAVHEGEDLGFPEGGK